MYFAKPMYHGCGTSFFVNNKNLDRKVGDHVLVRGQNERYSFDPYERSTGIVVEITARRDSSEGVVYQGEVRYMTKEGERFLSLPVGSQVEFSPENIFGYL